MFNMDGYNENWGVLLICLWVYQERDFCINGYEENNEAIGVLYKYTVSKYE